MRSRSAPRNRFKVFLVISLVIILTAGMLFQVWLRVKIRLLSAEIEHLNRDVITLREQINELQAGVTELSSYDEITSTAREKLGMIFIKQQAIR
jgi:cell division protein FtsL